MQPVFFYKKQLDKLQIEKIAGDENSLAFEPAFSKDGKSLVFVTWSDEQKGAIVKLNLTTLKTGNPETPGHHLPHALVLTHGTDRCSASRTATTNSVRA